MIRRMDFSSLFASGRLTVDAGQAIVETASLLRTVASSAPPIVQPKRRRAPERERAYLRFQQAAIQVLTWAEYLPVLKVAGPNSLNRYLYALALTARDWPGHRRPGGSDDHTYAPALLSADGMANALEKMALLNEASNSQYMPVLLAALHQFREATSTFLGALLEIRQVGNPEPRKAAEQITALLGELCGRTPASQPPWWKRTVVPALGRADGEKQRQQELEVCRELLGEAHRDFTLAVRNDLRLDRRPRRFRWPPWRPAVKDWPGGWPGPDGAQLIADALQRRREAEEKPGEPD